MEIEKEAFEAFVHGDERYMREWTSIKAENKSTFNFYAFFFGLAWLLYRKMYLPALVLAGILLLELLIEDKLFCVLCSVLGVIARFLPFFLNLVLTIIVGWYANRVYIWDAERKIKNIQQQNLSAAEYYLKLRQKGGKSWVPVLFLVMVLFGIYIYENRGPVQASKRITGPFLKIRAD